MDTRKTVLVVDDDALVLESIDLHLGMSGEFEVIRATGSTGADEILRGPRPLDLIIADVILAGAISGIDLCRKAIQRHPDIAVVVITADSEVHSEEIPYSGVFLRKPFGGEQLLEAIAKASARTGSTATLQQV